MKSANEKEIMTIEQPQQKATQAEHTRKLGTGTRTIIVVLLLLFAAGMGGSGIFRHPEPDGVRCGISA